jgi:signal transduction histidine kinase
MGCDRVFRARHATRVLANLEGLLTVDSVDSSEETRAADGSRARRGRPLRGWFMLPEEAEFLGEHRHTVLLRTRVAAAAALLVIPLTIFSFFGKSAEGLSLAARIVLPSLFGVALVFLALRTRYGQRHYQLPFFILVGVVCAGTEAVLLQLAPASDRQLFLFPYFLIMFGIAAFFPANFAWAVAAAVMCPVSYVVSEVLAHGTLRPGAPVANLILLGDYVLITVMANRVTTRLFFSELEHRLALERANQRLRDLDRARTDFIAGVSHDIRNPLNNIIAPLTAVSAQAEELKPRHRRFVELALRGATRIDSMISDLLELARLETGASTLHVQHLDLRDLLSSLLETTRPFATSRGYDLAFEAPGHPVWVVVDGEKIERVVNNLLSNALKYSRPGTTVTLALRDEHRHVSISVVDQGPGIAPADLERIFGRYTRLGAGSRAGPGTGLGLAIVKEFVALHQGEVQVESAVNQGSTFRVILPRAFAPPWQRDQSRAADAR